MFKAAIATSSSMYSIATLYSPSVLVSRARPKPTSLPASDCSSSVVCSRMWPIHVPRRSRSKNPPRTPSLHRCSIIDGSQLMSRSLKPSIISDDVSFSSSRSTQTSRTGKLAQMLGPRNLNTF